jgi:DNA-directed RNA polymerase specialized sigma24 family protein
MSFAAYNDAPDGAHMHASEPVPSGSTLGILMVAAQGGDRLAYRQLLAVVAMRAMEACMKDRWAQAIEAAERDVFACSVLQTVHTTMATFDPKHSFDAWLCAIISTRLTQSRRRNSAAQRVTDAHIARTWYQGLLF